MELRNITRRGRCAQRSGMTVSAHAGHARSSSRVKFPVLLAIPPARPPNGDRTPWCRPSIRKGPVPCREPTGSAPLVPARPELEAGREQNTPGNGEMTVAQRTDNSSCAAPVASTRPACAATWDTRLEPFRPVNDTSRRPVPPPHPAPSHLSWSCRSAARPAPGVASARRGWSSFQPGLPMPKRRRARVTATYQIGSTSPAAPGRAQQIARGEQNDLVCTPASLLPTGSRHTRRYAFRC